MLSSQFPSLSWLSDSTTTSPNGQGSPQNAAGPQPAPVPPTAEPAAAATAPELRQLEPMARDLAAMRRSLEQLVVQQEQMAQNIATLQRLRMTSERRCRPGLWPRRSPISRANHPSRPHAHRLQSRRRCHPQPNHPRNRARDRPRNSTTPLAAPSPPSDRASRIPPRTTNKSEPAVHALVAACPGRARGERGSWRRRISRIWLVTPVRLRVRFLLGLVEGRSPRKTEPRDLKQTRGSRTQTPCQYVRGR